MRVLVTGGAGYIGSVVTETLLETGHQVTVLDNFSKGHRDAIPAQVPVIEVNLLDRAAVERAFGNERFDAVVHMAADSLVGESVENPAKYYQNNLVGGLNLVDKMLAAGVRNLVFSSTAAVYGEPETQPITEDAPTRPTNPYGATKLALEEALRWYSGAYGLRYVSLRYFNAAGASKKNGERHSPETHLIPLTLQVASGEREALTIFGTDYATPDGTCVRDYIHVLDLADAHVLSLEALAQGAIDARFYNLGCGHGGYSVRQVLEVAEAVTKRKIPVKFGPRRPGDPAVLVASSERIQKELGFKPKRQDLTAIVGSAWKWMQARSDARSTDEGEGE